MPCQTFTYEYKGRTFSEGRCWTDGPTESNQDSYKPPSSSGSGVSSGSGAGMGMPPPAIFDQTQSSCLPGPGVLVGASGGLVTAYRITPNGTQAVAVYGYSCVEGSVVLNMQPFGFGQGTGGGGGVG